MKTLITIILTSIGSLAIAQQSFNFNAGIVYSTIADVDNQFAPGYYIGLGIQDEFGGIVGFSIDLNFINQRTRVSDIPVGSHSVNATSLIRLLLSDAFDIGAGIESGMVTAFSLDNERSSGGLDMRVGYVFNVSTRIAERLRSQLRFVGPFDHQQGGFAYNLQLGLSYALSGLR